MKVVSNSSPLITLARIGHLDSLRRLYGVVHIPTEVFDEVVIALFVSGGGNATLTRDMFNALRDQIDPTIAAISTVMIAVSSVLLACAQVLGGARR